jgi:hypothetical protein
VIADLITCTRLHSVDKDLTAISTQIALYKFELPIFKDNQCYISFQHEGIPAVPLNFFVVPAGHQTQAQSRETGDPVGQFLNI